MEIYVLNQSLERIGGVDVYESFSWDTKYNDIGSFELHCPLEFFGLLREERYIQCTADDYHNGIIEYIEKTTNAEGVENLVVKGRTLEAILERRTIKAAKYESVQPAAICADLIRRNAGELAEPARQIGGLSVGSTPNADEGVVSYSCAKTSLLDAVKSILQESQIGFRLYIDDADPAARKILFDMYKGENRTEEDNTETEINVVDVPVLLTNEAFTGNMDGWEKDRADPEHGYSVAGSGSVGNLIKKTKLWKRWKNEETGEKYEMPVHSGYLSQSVNLDSQHIYYMAIRANNPTASVVGFGLMDEAGACTLMIQNQTDFVEHRILYVPESPGKKPFVMGYGNLSDEPEKEGESLLMDYGLMIDLTATFGAGNEPGLEWCNENIYHGNGWKYKNQVIRFVENANDPLFFSRDRENLIEVEYTKTTVNERTVMYVYGQNDVTEVLTQGAEDGIARRECCLDVASSVPQVVDGITIPDASYRLMLQRAGRAELRKMVVNEFVDGAMYIYSPKQYGRDFHLGDLVTCSDNKIGFETILRINEASQTWDINGYGLSILFGEDVPDIYETMKLVTKGAK